MLAFALLLLAPPLAAQLPTLTAVEATAQADSAVTAWFNVLATRDYAGSWTSASPLFQKRIRQQDWESLADAWREQFARVGQRQLVESRYQQPQPPQAEGEYVTFRYVTRLSPDRQVSETVLLARDTEGVWRVADYLLWPNPFGDPVLYAPGPVGRPVTLPAQVPKPPPTNVARPR
jgi:hypothetical protein